MKKILIVLVILSIFVLSGCSISQEDCKEIAYKQVEEFEDIGYSKGLDKGIDIAEEEIKSIREQYTPREGCMILIIDDISARNICEGDKYYEELTV